MTHASNFLVIGFTRGTSRSLRPEVVIKASSESHAAALAADLAGDEGAAVTLSHTVSASADGPLITIIANYGGAPEDPEAWGLPGIPSSDPSRPARSSAGSILRCPPLSSAFSWLSFFGAARKQGGPRSARRSRAVASIVAAVVAAFVGSAVAYKASGAQREARLAEMAGHSCDHEKVSNKELRRFAKYGARLSATKLEALLIVIALCDAKSKQSRELVGIGRDQRQHTQEAEQQPAPSVACGCAPQAVSNAS